MIIKSQLNTNYKKIHSTLFLLQYSYKINIQKTYMIKNNVNG